MDKSILDSCKYNQCRANVLPLLHNMHKIISSGNDLNQILKVVMQIMETHMRVIRGMILLFDREIGQIRVFQAIGLTEQEQAQGVYALGEGITGRVVETGQHVVVPRISEEKEFLNRAYKRAIGEDSELSFICVPMNRGEKVLGAISAERVYDNPVFLQQDIELLEIISGMIAQEVELFLMENRSKSYQERERYRPDNIIGTSRPMMQAYSMVKKLAQAETTVMLLGESGVGKELFAGAIHYASARADQPFVCFNCGALPESLV
ncbi:MAG: GAF domain-containing protein [Spirochaetaceae bacterium]|nr:MAG: GAF domain-containing protein [Spirochaetaceae bacterium]